MDSAMSNDHVDYTHPDQDGLTFKDRSLTNQVEEILHIEHEEDNRPAWQKALTFLIKTALVLGFLWLFLVGLQIMGDAFKVLGGKRSGEMFRFASNPIAGLMIGIFATVLVQSSSTTTSIVVSLVSADSMTVETAVPVIMGANIGTSVTNTLVSLVHAHDPNEFKRAFAGATVHDFFNILNVIVFLPIEAATGMLRHLTGAMVDGMSKGAEFESPTKKIISPFAGKFIKANKDVIKAVAKCDGYDRATYIAEDCDGQIAGRLAKSGFLSKIDTDAGAGIVALLISLLFSIVALLALVKVLNHSMKGSSAAFIKKMVRKLPSFAAMAVGAGLTIMVQSSSITTSTLVPLVGVGVIDLERMFPFTLGANVGTTVTALLAAVSSGKTSGMQIALCHLFFNIFGILVWYPLPFLRNIPIFFAKQLGMAVARRRSIGAWYTAVMFFFVPGLFLLLSIAGDGVVLGVGIPILLFAIAFAVLLYIRGNHPEKVPAWIPQFLQPHESGDRYEDDIVIGNKNEVEMTRDPTDKVGSDSSDVMVTMDA